MMSYWVLFIGIAVVSWLVQMKLVGTDEFAKQIQEVL